MKLTMLGTGNALVTECYNTCFVVQNGKKHTACGWRRRKYSAGSAEACRI